MAITKVQNKINNKVSIKKYYSKINQIEQFKQIIDTTILSQDSLENITDENDKNYLYQLSNLNNKSILQTHKFSIIKK